MRSLSFVPRGIRLGGEPWSHLLVKWFHWVVTEMELDGGVRESPNLSRTDQATGWGRALFLQGKPY